MIRAGDFLGALQSAPVCAVADITHRRPVLLLAPHPDDESLAWGGFIAAACAQGDDVHVAILTDGSRSHPDSPTFPASRVKALREAEARAAVAALGLPPDRISFLAQPDAHAPHDGAAFGAAADRLTRWARERRICTIVTTWRHDPHCDHEAASKLAAEVCRRIAARHLETPVWGWTLNGDTPLPAPPPCATRIDIAPHLPAKRRAIAAHASQMNGLIEDSPTGFRLQPEFLAIFDRPWEVFVDA